MSAFDPVRIGNRLARPRRVQTTVSRLHARVLRASRGRLRRSFVLAFGQPVLSLTTTGRRSGRRRSTAVAYMWDGDNLVVSGANAGLDRPPAWWLNLQATPRAEVEVEGRRIAVRAREAEGEERARLWRRYVERTPAVERTAALTERAIPLVVLEPVG